MLSLSHYNFYLVNFLSVLSFFYLITLSTEIGSSRYTRQLRRDKDGKLLLFGWANRRAFQFLRLIGGNGECGEGADEKDSEADPQNQLKQRERETCFFFKFLNSII